MDRHPNPARPPAAFTMPELLVVITIIVLLASILVPVVSKVRRAARNADVQNQMSEIAQACDRYYNDYHAYPGPLSNDVIRSNSTNPAVLGVTFVTPAPPNVAGSPF